MVWLLNHPPTRRKYESAQTGQSKDPFFPGRAAHCVMQARFREAGDPEPASCVNMLPVP